MTQDEINAVKKAAEKMRKQESAQDEIIEMAREVGLVIDGNQSGLDDLQAFAHLVAAKEREFVGLTGEEAMDVTRKESHALLDFIYEYGTGVEGVEERIVAICKAIEAKLKEKNT
jgi:hypothetical protein